MADYHYANAMSLANDFAVKLLSGLLNVRVDLDSDVLGVLEQSYTDEDFTTDCMPALRLVLLHSRLTLLEASDSKVDPDTAWRESELRHVTIYAKEGENGSVRRRATFDVFRHYVDMDEGGSWSPWRVKNVCVFSSTTIELFPKYINGVDCEPVWGTRINHKDQA